ncbi:hypothetical protein [Ectopseudomonas mendocina]|uniref:hypothetical protein n=1 Tax=Ectopseudomonas mendocina TaxID=300 RepID=UPI0023EB9EFA|nr:hypothetical protein [Pseudomonas mendocina]
MKKFLASVVVLGGFFASSAYAEPITSGVPIQAGNQGCELLAEAVTISLSSNVFGQYSCNTETNIMRVATCHKGGSRKKGTVNCAIVNVVDGVNEWNDSSCSDAKAAAAAAGGEPHVFETDDKGKAFTVSTSGGSVGASSLTAPCTGANVLEDFVD